MSGGCGRVRVWAGQPSVGGATELAGVCICGGSGESAGKKGLL